MHAETQSPGATVQALLRAGVRLLAASSDSPRLDAEVLLAHALGRSRGALFIGREDRIPQLAADSYLGMIHARQRGQPVAQITGHREFWSLDLLVTADVLTPRPETELLVERVLARVPETSSAALLDLGTGSGAIALAIAVERPGCSVVATDASAAALDVARRNAAALGLNTVRFTPGHWFAAIGAQIFDVIVSNPPYLAAHELTAADAALTFEPRVALAGGIDGLDAIRLIVAGAPAHLAPGGWLLLEHGMSQGPAVRELLVRTGFQQVVTLPDLSGLPRVTEGRRLS